ncbi:MAG TPA: hypothetical protein VNI83_04665 [Vicinamibacterales bacterium]|nr:hypothetical protein [Vicinamibacterales bacterium]
MSSGERRSFGALWALWAWLAPEPPDVVIALGLVLVGAGCAWISPPLGLIVPGAIVILLAALDALVAGPREKGRS